ncbi:MAG: PaaI family thioesterase [Minwuia sp.]|uniref:PaaI family thioesterase n=1 Tax=Minwuia sp. TaxID=2493630 RepID=UPI003A86A498
MASDIEELARRDPSELSWYDKIRLMGSTAEGQFRALGLSVESAGDEGVLLRLPWQEKLVGDPVQRILHGGCITTLIDSACGYALMAYSGQLPDIATLDLRIDYLKPAQPDIDVMAFGQVYRTTTSIAFLRAQAYQTEGDPIANAVGTFMLGANAPKYAARGITQR